MDYQNETLKVINNRATCRNFSDEKISAKIIELLLSAAIKSPSGGDLQAISIVQIEDKSSRKFLRKLSLDQSYVEKAPLSLLFCIDWHRTMRMCSLDPSPTGCENDTMNYILGLVEVGIAAQNVCIAAESLGLGSVYIGNIINYLPQVKEYFNLPDHVYPGVLLSIGYPKTKKDPHAKFPSDIIVHKEKYKELDDEDLIDAFKKRYSNINIKLTDKMLSKYTENCYRMYEKEKADNLIDHVIRKGYLGMNQYTFGVFMHKFKNSMNNDDHVKFLRDSGFEYF